MANGNKAQTPAVPAVLISSIRILSITFTSDHNILNDYDTDWNDNLDPHVRPEWTSNANHSISHDMGTRVALNVELAVEPADATPELLSIKGTVNQGGAVPSEDVNLVFQSSPVFRVVRGGTVKLDLTSDRELPRRVMDFNFTIDWSVVRKDTSLPQLPSATLIPVSPTRTTNRMFITFGRPGVPDGRKDVKSPPRLGITRIRMEEATLAASEAELRAAIPPTIRPQVDPLDPHHVALGLILRFSVDPDVDVENEWTIGGGGSPSAACYPIARYADAVMAMLGCSGMRSLHVVWAWARSPDSPVLNDAPYPNMHFDESNHERLQSYGKYGLPADAQKKNWLAWLDSGGRNKFEACLRLTHGQRTKLYAPGFGAFDSAKQVLFQFDSMSWFDGQRKMGIIFDYHTHKNP